MSHHRNLNWQTTILYFLLACFAFPLSQAQAAPGNLSFKQAIYSTDESIRTLSIKIVRTEGADGEVAVDFSTAPDTTTPSTFTQQNLHLTFADGQLEAAVDVPIPFDHLPGSYTFFLTLSNPTGGATSQPDAVPVTVQNAEPSFSFGSVTNITTFEGNTNLFIDVSVQTVLTSAQLNSGIEVVFEGLTATPGADYVDGSRILYRTNLTAFPKARIPVSIILDHLVEPEETFRIYLRSADGIPGLVNTGGSSNITVTILPSGQPGMVDYASMAQASFFTNLSAYVYTIFPLPDGDFILGGNFDKSPSRRSDKYFRYSSSFEVRTNFVPITNAYNEIRPTANGKLLAINWGTNSTLTVRNAKVDRYLPNGVLDPSFANPATFVNFNIFLQKSTFELVELLGGTLLGKGDIDYIGGRYSPGLGKLLRDGTTDPNFLPFITTAGRPSEVLQVSLGGLLARPDGSAWISASLPSYGLSDNRPTQPYLLHRISPLGFIDADFHPGWNGRLETLTPFPGGRVLGLGTVTNTDASIWVNPILDTNANIVGSAPWLGTTLRIAATQSDGRFLVVETNVVLRRYSPEGVEDTTFTPFNAKSFRLTSVDYVVLRPDNKIVITGNPIPTGPKPQTIYILENNPAAGYAAVSLPDGNVLENKGSMTVKLARFGGSQGTLTASLQSTIIEGINHDRIQPLEMTVDFVDGEVGPKELSFPILDNTTLDGDLRVRFQVTTLNNPAAPTSVQTMLVQDNDYGTAALGFDGLPDILASVVQDDGRVVYATTTGVIRRDRNGKLSADFTKFQKSLSPPCILAVGDDGGIFLAALMENRNQILKLGADGTPAGSFSVEADGEIRCLLPTGDNELVVGGAFQHVQGKPRIALAKVFGNDGALDSRFFCTLKAGSLVNHLQEFDDAQERYLVGGSLVWDSIYDKPVPHGLAWVRARGEQISFPALDNCTVFQVLPQRNGQIVLQGRADADSSTNAFHTTSLIRIRQNHNRVTGDFFELDPTFQSPLGLMPSPLPGDRTLGQLSDNSILVLVINTAIAPTSATLHRLNGFGRIDESFHETEILGRPLISMAGDIAVHTGGLKFNLPDSFRKGSLVLTPRPLLLSENPPHRFSLAVVNGELTEDQECLIQNTHSTHDANSYEPSLDLRIPLSKGQLKRILNINFPPAPTNSVAYFHLKSSSTLPTAETNAAPFVLLFTGFNLANEGDYYPWAAHIDGAVAAMADGGNGTVFAGGSFATWEGIPINGLAKLHRDGALDLNFINDSPEAFHVTSMLWVEGEGLYVAREFQNNAQADSWQLIRLRANGQRDPGFAPVVANGAINTLLRQWPGTVTFAGNFTRLNGLAAQRVARVRNDGMLDDTMKVGAGPDGEVLASALLSDGSLLLGGSFDQYQGSPSKGLAKTHPDGTRDQAFSVGAGFSGTVTALGASFDGRVLVGGAFTNYDNLAQTNWLSFLPDWQLDGRMVATNAPNGPVDQIFVEQDNSFFISGPFNTFGPYSSMDGAFKTDSDGNPPTSFLSRRTVNIFWLNFSFFPHTGKTRLLSQLSEGRLVYTTTANQTNLTSAIGFVMNKGTGQSTPSLARSSDGNTITFSATSPARDGLAFDLQDNGQTVLSTTNLTASFNIPGSTAGPHYWRVLVRDGTSVIGASEYLIIPPAVTIPEARWSAPLLLGDGTVKLDLTGENSGTWIIERSSDLHDWTPIATNATTITLTLGDTNLFIRARK